MTAFAVLILFIFMARSHQRPDFWVWTGKGAQFIVLLFGLETITRPAISGSCRRSCSCSCQRPSSRRS
jgi:hypothetical protein